MGVFNIIMNMVALTFKIAICSSVAFMSSFKNSPSLFSASLTLIPSKVPVVIVGVAIMRDKVETDLTTHVQSCCSMEWAACL